MTTSKQLAANRQNALRSTGPRTPEGKAVSSMNARTHGLLCRGILLPDEDRNVFQTFSRGLREPLRPRGDLEDLLADRIISCAWRMRRALVMEVDVLQNARKNWRTGEDDVNLGKALTRTMVDCDVFGNLGRYERGLERSLYKALHELQRHQAVQLRRKVPLPMAVDVSLDAESGPQR